jgi:RNA polymerase sigma-70 factor (ECF subfamily)
MTEFQLLFLVRQAQGGDSRAFGKLVQEFESTVFAIVMRRLRNTAEAAEVTQDVFVRAYRKLSQLREPERFVGWLKRIAVRLSINRAVRRPNESLQSPEMFDAYGGRQDTPMDGLVRQERARDVSKGLSRLRKLDRETLLAFYFEGQSLKEMSDRFSSPVGTIKRRLHTARARLKEALGDLQPA